MDSDGNGFRRLMAIALLAGCASAPPKPVPQNPSPTTESTRAHRRLQRDDARKWTTIEGALPKAVAFSAAGSDLLIHFHGAAWLPIQAAPKNVSVAVVNLGSGSSVYERPFLDLDVFPRLLASLPRAFDRVYVSGFSAGYGAIRAILRTHPDRVDGVLLLDGLHTSYVPDGRPGPLDATKLEPFVTFAPRSRRREDLHVHAFRGLPGHLRQHD